MCFVCVLQPNIASIVGALTHRFRGGHVGLSTRRGVDIDIAHSSHRSGNPNNRYGVLTLGRIVTRLASRTALRHGHRISV